MKRLSRKLADLMRARVGFKLPALRVASDGLLVVLVGHGVLAH
jgi:hypothetical protein